MPSAERLARSANTPARAIVQPAESRSARETGAGWGRPEPSTLSGVAAWRGRSSVRSDPGRVRLTADTFRGAVSWVKRLTEPEFEPPRLCPVGARTPSTRTPHTEGSTTRIGRARGSNGDGGWQTSTWSALQLEHFSRSRRCCDPLANERDVDHEASGPRACLTCQAFFVTKTLAVAIALTIGLGVSCGNPSSAANSKDGTLAGVLELGITALRRLPGRGRGHDHHAAIGRSNRNHSGRIERQFLLEGTCRVLHSHRQ